MNWKKLIYYWRPNDKIMKQRESWSPTILQTVELWREKRGIKSMCIPINSVSMEIYFVSSSVCICVYVNLQNIVIELVSMKGKFDQRFFIQ